MSLFGGPCGITVFVPLREVHLQPGHGHRADTHSVVFLPGLSPVGCDCCSIFGGRRSRLTTPRSTLARAPACDPPPPPPIPLRPRPRAFPLHLRHSNSYFTCRLETKQVVCLSRHKQSSQQSSSDAERVYGVSVLEDIPQVCASAQHTTLA